MAKRSNQKLKLVYLMQILLEKTDDTHSITMPEIIASLLSHGIAAERKSIYADMEALRTYGLDIIGEQKDKGYYYHIGSRTFELAELKLLVDSVQSSRFITVKKSHELIKKIEGLGSKYEAKQLQRQVCVAKRSKAMNESIYYNVDQLHYAINSNVKIQFQYFQWNIDKKMEIKKEGQLYTISPWALSWDDENYYLIGYDGEANQIKHYRVDKMLNIELTVEKRDGKVHFQQFDMAIYAKKMFGMFHGKEEHVKLSLENQLAGVIIDRFGKDILFTKTDEQHFAVTIKVAVSGQFFGWVMALGKGARIVGPENVVEMLREEAKRLVEQYDDNNNTK